jgi:hypothetical protein
MAQKANVILVDDIDGSEAAETVPFALDGTHYEIDLNLQHARELRTRVAPFIGKARKVTVRGARSARPRGSAASGGSNKEIRDWARQRGRKVNDRGRIPAGIIAEYETENPKQRATAS